MKKIVCIYLAFVCFSAAAQNTTTNAVNFCSLKDGNCSIAQEPQHAFPTWPNFVIMEANGAEVLSCTTKKEDQSKIDKCTLREGKTLEDLAQDVMYISRIQNEQYMEMRSEYDARIKQIVDILGPTPVRRVKTHTCKAKSTAAVNFCSTKAGNCK